MMVAENGRCISVGDKNPAIYGWSGASSDAMERVARDWNAVIMPLSINYRCSKAVVRCAHVMVPEIEAWDQAPEGSVETLDEFKLTDFLPTDAILCRVNAPNIRLNYRLIAAGIPCRMKKRDIDVDKTQWEGMLGFTSQRSIFPGTWPSSIFATIRAK
jgi:DNA helicase II / ATP-dependent DNA helicase PcrA